MRDRSDRDRIDAGDDSDVQAWVVGLDASVFARRDRSGWMRLLDDDERARAGRFVFDRDRVRYVLAHAALRAILARRLGTGAGDIRFARAAGGKPELDRTHHREHLRFSLSHSHELALVAARSGGEVGADLERVTGFHWDGGLARRAFPGRIVEQVEALPPEARAAAFLRTWVRAEAVAKAAGTGLTALPFTAEIVEAEGMTVVDIVPRAGFVGAVAAPGRWQLTWAEYNEDGDGRRAG